MKIFSRGPVKLKRLIYYAFVIVLAVVSNGCLTQAIMFNAKWPMFDNFKPSAVYQTTNDGSFAFEGIYSNRPARVYDTPPSFRGYLIIPENSLAFRFFQTNGNTGISTIQKLPPDMSRRLKTENSLPSGYEKLVTLPPNDVVLQINETFPDRKLYALLPFAFVIDVATLPLELLVYAGLPNQ